MKTKNPFGILMLFLFTFTVIGCDESYQLIPMEGRVTATERWTFLIDLITHRTGITMDAFTVTLPGSSGNSGDSTSQVWLYQDITEQVKASFPNAGVKTVVFAQIIELLF